MNAEDIKALVDEGVKLNMEIAAREKRVKEIDAKLKEWAKAHPTDHVPLNDTEREGSRFLCRGTDVILPVTFTSDHLRQSFDDGEEALNAVTEAAAGKIQQFYRPKTEWKAVHMKSSRFDGKGFRAAARELLPDPERFIQLCLRRDRHGVPVSQVRAEWDCLERIS